MEKKSVKISLKLYDIINKYIQNSNEEFDSIDEYVEYALSQIFDEEMSSQYTKGEEVEIKKHLKDMGYL